MIKMKVNCLKCIHYYVTWEKDYPRGCRALNFKTRYFPASVVSNSSGMPCLYYKERQATENLKKPGGS